MTAAQEKIPAPDPVPPLHEDTLAYTPTARSVTLSRRRVARLVREWGYGARAGEAALLTGELATNALLHGSVRERLFQVRVAVVGDVLRIEVADPRADRLPEVREAGETDRFGRGLVIVDAIADRWGVEPRCVGKTVFAELVLGHAADAAAGRLPVG
ncbi:ATP-binding protein [Streptomyces sp. NPDC002530]